MWQNQGLIWPDLFAGVEVFQGEYITTEAFKGHPAENFLNFKLGINAISCILIVSDSRLISANHHWSGGETVCDQSTLMPYSYVSSILHN